MLKKIDTKDLFYIFRLNIKDKDITTGETKELFDELLERYYKENRAFDLPKIIARCNLNVRFELGSILVKKEMEKDMDYDVSTAENYLYLIFCFFREAMGTKEFTTVYSKYFSEDFWDTAFKYVENICQKFGKKNKSDTECLSSTAMSDYDGIKFYYEHLSEQKEKQKENKNTDNGLNLTNETVEIKPELKVEKSKLKRDEMEQIIKNIHKFSEKEQYEYIVYAAKKWRRDIFYLAPEPFFTNFLLEHDLFFVKDTTGTSLLCPFKMLQNGFNFSELYKYKGFKSLYEYKKYLKDFYMKRLNATEAGFNYYFSKNLFNTVANFKNHIPKEELEEFCTVEVFFEVEKLLQIIESNKDYSFTGMMKEVEFPCRLFSYSTDPFIREVVPDNYGSFSETRTLDQFIISSEPNLDAKGKTTYIKLLETLIQVLQNLHIIKNHSLYIQGKNLESNYDEFDYITHRLNLILKKINIVNEDIKTIKEYAFSGGLDINGPKLEKVVKYILLHLCHTENVKPFAELVTENVENVKFFWKIVQYYNSQLASHNYESYKNAEDIFFTIYNSLDNIDLSTPEKRLKLFTPNFFSGRVCCLRTPTKRFEGSNNTITRLLMKSLEIYEPQMCNVVNTYVAQSDKYSVLRHMIFNENGKLLKEDF